MHFPMIPGPGWRYALLHRGKLVGAAGHDTNLCAMFAAEDAMIDTKIDEALLEGLGAGPPLGLFGEAE